MMALNKRFLAKLLILNLIIYVSPIQHPGIPFCSAASTEAGIKNPGKGVIRHFTLTLKDILRLLKDFLRERRMDTDKDGIPDDLDKCPGEPETYNDYRDGDGCPDTLPVNNTLTGWKKQALAAKYAPILYFHKKERWFPAGVEEMLNHSTLKKLKPLRDEVKVKKPTPDDLMKYNSDEYYLDLSCDKDDWPSDSPKKVYAHVFEAQDPEGGGEPYLVIQYWFFYIGDDPTFGLEKTPDNPFACNSHEGDWEMMQIIFDPEDKIDYLNWPPMETGYSQHYWGTRKSWVNTRKDENHPRAYIARGSHASYHTPVDLEFKCDHARGDIRVDPGMYLLHTLSNTSIYDMKWIMWEGHWGEFWSLLPYSSGPPGPLFRHSKFAYGLGGSAYYMWSDPINWQKELDQG